MTAIWSELLSYSLLELIAVAASVIYIVFAANNNRWCWPAAFVGSAIFAAVFWRYNLLMDSALNIYYTVMAIYGWVVWNRHRNNETEAPIIDRSVRFHVTAITGVILLSICSGYWLSQNTSASFPYLDSFTTWGSLLATWMLTQRMIENWLYWIAFDSVSIYLYLNKSLMFTVALFSLYIIMSLFGCYKWHKLKNAQRLAHANAAPTSLASASNSASRQHE